MVNWNMACTPIKSQTKGGYEEWAPELGHATMVFNRWWSEGLGDIIITRNQLVKGGMIGVSDFRNKAQRVIWMDVYRVYE